MTMRPRKEQVNKQRYAAIYIRVSTDKQVQSGLGLQDQMDKVMTESKRLGYDIAQDYIFIDEGISGKKEGSKRPNYDAMMKLVASGDISVVIVNDLSRLGRSVLLIAQAVDVFSRNDCAIVSVKESINTGNAMGKLVLNIIASIAQVESDLASERTKEALNVRGAKHGYKGGQLPYGYTRVNNSDAGKSDEVISIDYDEASIVRAIFSLRNTGLSMAAIADRCNDLGPSPRGSIWYAATIKIVLDNASYYQGNVAQYPAII